jgi:hypothetical protein
MWLSRVVAHTDCECLTLQRARFDELMLEVQSMQHSKLVNTFAITRKKPQLDPEPEPTSAQMAPTTQAAARGSRWAVVTQAAVVTEEGVPRHQPQPGSGRSGTPPPRRDSTPPPRP